MTRTAKPNDADWWARILGILSLVISIFTLYCSVLRSPEIDVSVGQHVLINRKPRIGVLCTFTNAGAKQTVITSAQLKWDNPDITLSSEMTSSNFEQWEFDDKGAIKTVVPTRYTPIVSPIPVKGHDQASVMFWFTSTNAAFSFTTGNHTAIISLMNGSRKIAEKNLKIHLKDIVVTSLNDPQSPPTAEYRAEVIEQD
jgi:hypothetical protein